MCCDELWRAVTKSSILALNWLKQLSHICSPCDTSCDSKGTTRESRSPKRESVENTKVKEVYHFEL